MLDDMPSYLVLTYFGLSAQFVAQIIVWDEAELNYYLMSGATCRIGQNVANSLKRVHTPEVSGTYFVPISS